MPAPEVRSTISLSQGEFATVGMLHDHATRIAEAEFAKAVAGRTPPFQCPFLWLVKTQRLLLTIETPWADDDEKIRSMQMMRTYMQMANATAYSFMHEAWMAVFTPPNVPKEMPYSVRALPPDQREDVLLVWTFDRSDKHMQTRWGVRRAGTPRAALLARDDVESSGYDHFEGRMFNLLKPPKPMSVKPGDDMGETPTMGDPVAYRIRCPHCDKQSDEATVMNVQSGTPKHGDVTLCVACGNFAKIDDASPGGSRKLNEAESFTLSFDPRLRTLREAWKQASDELKATRAGS